jgi:DASS family divalent anion:Na+ symporter
MFKLLVDALIYFRSAVPFRLIPALISTLVLVGLLLLPAPEGLKPEAWVLVAIFVTTIVAIILKVMSIGVMAIMAMLILALSKSTSSSSSGAVADALGSMSSPLIWLIVVAVLISRGLKKTGLGNRLGLFFISMLGRRTLGIGYGLVLCELLLAPFTPSNTARGGGIIHPIMKSIANTFDSDPEKGTQQRIGTYLALVNYHANPITSGMFITATAPNPLVVDYVARVTNQSFHLSWSAWALYMLVPGLFCLALMPLLLYWCSPPEIKSTPNAVAFAREQLKKMGPLHPKEKIMLGTFALLLLLWADLPAMVLGPVFSLDPTVVALLGLFTLLITGTLNWDDVLSEKSAWDTLIWFGALVMLANQLNKMGVIVWFSSGLQRGLDSAGLS